MVSSSVLVHSLICCADLCLDRFDLPPRPLSGYLFEFGGQGDADRHFRYFAS